MPLGRECPNSIPNQGGTDGNLTGSQLTITGAFVSHLLAESLSPELPLDRPIVISRVRIEGDVVVDSGTTRALVILHCSTVVGRVTFESRRMLQPMVLHGVTVTGRVEFVDVDARSSVMIRDSTLNSVEIMGSRFNRNLSFRGTSVRDRLKIVSTPVGHDLTMGCYSASPSGSRCARYGPTVFLNVSISGGLDMRGSCFVGGASFRDSDVSRRFLADDVVFSDGLARSEGKLQCGRWSIDPADSGGLRVEGTTVGGGLTLRRGRYGDVAIIRTHVHRELDVTESQLRSLDLSGTTVHGELRIGSGTEENHADPPLDAARFIARHTRVESLRLAENWWRPWPDRELDGFEYENLSGFSDSGETAFVRDPEWFKAWLPDGDAYSPEPYMHLSTVLREQGRSDVAEAILYAAKDRERRNLSHYDPARWELFLLRWIVGYGIGWRMLWHAIAWMAVFAALGWGWAAWNLRHQRCVSGWTLLWFSVSRTVPGFTAVKHDAIWLPSRVRSWFYVQQLLGYAFAILAGSAIVQIFES